MQVYLLGFLTIASQVFLIREIFSTLYGSDVAIAFAMASWTFFSGLGAFWVGRLLLHQRVTPKAGIICYTIMIVLVFLAVRRWGATELITFHHYLRIPFYLCGPCLLGGALFWWSVDAYGGTSGKMISRAYADETLGGMFAGILLTAYLFVGGKSLPALLSFFALALCHASFLGRMKVHRLFFPLISILFLAIPLLQVFSRIDKATLRLHYPEYEILAHCNTPYGALTAGRRGGEIFLFENGVPMASLMPTPNKEALCGLLTQFSSNWHRVLILNGVSSGFVRSLARYSNCDTFWYEQDPARIAFQKEWQTNKNPVILPPLLTGFSPWRVTGKSMDLIVHFASVPGSLQQNQKLTLEFFHQARAHLSLQGVVAVILPKAPGFMHPLQRRYVNSVHLAMAGEFKETCVVETDLGYAVLIGSARAIPDKYHAERLQQRYHESSSSVASEIVQVFSDAMHPLLVPMSKGEGHKNSVLFPFAYFAYLQYRAKMVDDSALFWNIIFEEHSIWLACLVFASLFLIGTLTEKKCSGSRALFWTSWTVTITLMFSIYLYQSIVGQAYWLVALLIAGTMFGIFVGAFTFRGKIVHPAAPFVILFLPGLFFCYEWLQLLSNGLLLLVLLAVNGCMGWHQGQRFAATSKENEARAESAGLLFLIDLLGATCGLILGAVVIAWWIGFQNVALLTAATGLTSCYTNGNGHRK